MMKVWQSSSFSWLYIEERITDKLNFRKTKWQVIYFCITYLQQAPISKSVAYQFVQMHQTLMVANMVGENRKHHCVLKNNEEKHSSSLHRIQCWLSYKYKHPICHNIHCLGLSEKNKKIMVSQSPSPEHLVKLDLSTCIITVRTFPCQHKQNNCIISFTEVFWMRKNI